VLLTPDGNHLRIPNAKVYKAVIVNYTRNPKRRFDFDVGVDTEQNLADAQKLAASTLAEMKGVERDPPPFCHVQSLGDSNVVLRTYGWVDQTRAEFGSVRSEATRLVKAAFDRAGIVMPNPIYNVHVDRLPHRPDAAPARPAPTEPQPAKQRRADEPASALDIERRDGLAAQIEDTRQPEDEDLLHPNAARE
jgi:small-conductance mechanosensitive channel